MKSVLCTSVLALVVAAPAVAAAQSASGGSCPPGSWFCAEPPSSQSQASPAGQPVQRLQPLPERDEAPASPPPVVVYQPPAPVVVVRPESPPPYEYGPPPPPRRHYLIPAREWGLNLHLEGAAVGNGANMGGLGAGLRFKVSRMFGIEGDLDFVGGHGYAGDQRNETALTFNGLLFLNPRDRAQLYLVGGFGWSRAHSTNDPNDPTQQPFSNDYTYFGAQAGIGLELRLTRVLALNADFRAFVRSRVDQGAQSQPEFTSPAGQTTNTSGGGVFQGGMTLYF